MTDKNNKLALCGIHPAKVTDLEHIKTMYQSVIGQNGCTWNENYPTSEDIMNDFNSRCLYVLWDEYNLLGAVSVVPENELDDIECWKINDGTQREIARVVVPLQYQGNGYSKEMLRQLFTLLKSQGCKTIHLLVAKNNEAAIKTYRELGFEFPGECNRYGHDFYICEKVLTDE